MSQDPQGRIDIRGFHNIHMLRTTQVQQKGNKLIKAWMVLINRHAPASGKCSDSIRIEVRMCVDHACYSRSSNQKDRNETKIQVCARIFMLRSGCVHAIGNHSGHHVFEDPKTGTSFFWIDRVVRVQVTRKIC